MSIRRRWNDIRMKPIHVYWKLREKPMWRRFVNELAEIDHEAAGLLRGSRYWWDPYIDEWTVTAQSDAAFERVQQHADALAVAGRRTGANSILIAAPTAGGVFVHYFNEE